MARCGEMVPDSLPAGRKVVDWAGVRPSRSCSGPLALGAIESRGVPWSREGPGLKNEARGGSSVALSRDSGECSGVA